MSSLVCGELECFVLCLCYELRLRCGCEFRSPFVCFRHRVARISVPSDTVFSCTQSIICPRSATELNMKTWDGGRLSIGED